jgi:hypothetical protein
MGMWSKPKFEPAWNKERRLMHQPAAESIRKFHSKSAALPAPRGESRENRKIRLAHNASAGMGMKVIHSMTVTGKKVNACD